MNQPSRHELLQMTAQLIQTRKYFPSEMGQLSHVLRFLGEEITACEVPAPAHSEIDSRQSFQEPVADKAVVEKPTKKRKKNRK